MQDMICLPGVWYVRKGFQEEICGADSLNKYAAVLCRSCGVVVGIRGVPFWKEGELSLKAEMLVSQGGDGRRQLDQKDPVPWRQAQWTDSLGFTRRYQGTTKGFSATESQMRSTLQDWPSSHLECGRDGGWESVEKESVAGSRQGCEVCAEARRCGLMVQKLFIGPTYPTTGQRTHSERKQSFWVWFYLFIYF